MLKKCTSNLQHRKGDYSVCGCDERLICHLFVRSQFTVLWLHLIIYINIVFMIQTLQSVASYKLFVYFKHTASEEFVFSCPSLQQPVDAFGLLF